MGAGQSAPTRNDAKAQMKMQMRREAAILIQDASCENELRAFTAEKNPEELADQIDQFFTKSKLETGFYDPEFMRAMSCILRVGLTVDRQLSASKYVKEFFTDKRQIGANSVEGVAMMSGMKANRSMFVIKAPKNPNNDNLVHEYFVAAGGAFTALTGEPKIIIGTNWLRKVCLNYAQILGAFRCSPPEIDPLGKVVRGWCNTDTPSSFVNYVVYEKVDGRDLKAHASTDMTAVHFVTTIIQLAYALEIAQVYNGFTHYDLHSENVILRQVNMANPQEEALIPFVISEDLTVYIESPTIATIIDFGRCHIQTPAPAAEFAGEKTEHFGFFGLEFMGLFSDRARPYYDIFKIIGFTLYDMAAAGNPAFEECWPIMGFFGLRSRDQVIQWAGASRTNGNLFSLETDAEKAGFCLTKALEGQYVCLPEKAATMFDFLEYVEAQFPHIWQAKVKGYPVAGQKVLQCGADCTSFAGAIQNMTTDKSIGTPAANLAALGDLRNVMRYRNNLNVRGLYFQENFPASIYGSKLIKEVEKIDGEIIEAFPSIGPAIARQILDLGEKVKSDYAAIGYPVVYAQQPSSNPAVFTQELVSLRGYLDRMQTFAKSFVEFKEFYEAGEDMTRIAGNAVSTDLTNYLEGEINPLYQAYDNSKAEIRRILERTPVTQEYVEFRQDLIVRTL